MKPIFLFLLGLLLSPLSYTYASPAVITGGKATEADTSRKAPHDWFNLDPQESKIHGISTEKAYEFLRNRPSQTVVVAVIDSGIDIDHEDLKDNIWINEDEIAGNGVDDDRNGYVDDVHGWNFIGGANGRNVEYDTFELTRLYVALREKFEGPKSKKFQRKEKENYALYRQVKEEYERKVQEAQAEYAQFQQIYDTYKITKAILGDHLGKDTFAIQEVVAINTSDEQIRRAKELQLYMAQNGLTQKQLTEGEDYFTAMLQYQLNPEYDPRDIVGDDYQNLKERYYGNNDVEGNDAVHGTHVAGIIAANRQNGIGISGIANDVKIMVIRAVPDGDERDKDVANAIYYAVDNGARIINMSFGKAYSPHKAAVDAAIKYAAKKGVLLVHAAGNDAKNIDEANSFPTKKITPKKEVNNWIEVGASSWGDSTLFVGNFSNYGKKTVDVFAPGVDIHSTVPNHGYEPKSGTSMAAPVTSGVCALLLSYYPTLTAEQVRDIVLKSTVKYPELQVNKPGEGETQSIGFGQLSVTGGIVNAYEALKLAESMTR